MGNDYNYTYGPASKYKESRPCTNVIIECPECAQTKGKKPMGQYFWKYVCMETHWARMHSTVEKPAALVEALKLHPDEIEKLKSFAKSKDQGGQARKRARRAKQQAADAPVRAAKALERLNAALVTDAATAATTTDAATTDGLYAATTDDIQSL